MGVHFGVHLTDSYLKNESKVCKVQFPFKIHSNFHSYEISIDFLQRNANQNAAEKGKEIECRRKALRKKMGNLVPPLFLKGIFSLEL